jgi:hypothetical protein
VSNPPLQDQVDTYPIVRSDRLELQLSYGHLSFDLLGYYFKKGEKYYYSNDGNKVSRTGFTLVYYAIYVG